VTVAEAPVLAERRGHVGVAYLNRPDAHNALSDELLELLGATVAAWDADPEVRCIVIAGGKESFAAGTAKPSAPFWPRLAACGTPLVAAVSGFALGGGCELALHCDMIVSSETAEFGLPEVLGGALPGAGGAERLARVAGKHVAMELVLTSRRIDAREAHRIGIVNHVVGKKEWLERAIELAEVVARRPSEAVRHAKQAVLEAL
jgi:enoyl-CoA hydratase